MNNVLIMKSLKTSFEGIFVSMPIVLNDYCRHQSSLHFSKINDSMISIFFTAFITSVYSSLTINLNKFKIEKL